MLLRKLIDRAARAYVAGPGLADAIGFARAIAADGLASTIAYWNDAGEDPEQVHAVYSAAIDGAAEAGIRSYVSCKAPALAMSKTAAASLAVRCRDRGIGLHFDSLRPTEQAPTLDLIERLLPAGAVLGCTLPARFARSVDDAERANALQLRVRVVKGQFADPGGEVDPRAGFLALIDRLAGRAAHVAVGTHDPALAEESLRRLAARGTSAELELLLGLPVHGAREVARRLDVPVRIYIPYGHAWLPYSLRAASRNPRIVFWMLADALRGHGLRASRRL